MTSDGTGPVIEKIELDDRHKLRPFKFKCVTPSGISFETIMHGVVEAHALRRLRGSAKGLFIGSTSGDLVAAT